MSRWLLKGLRTPVRTTRYPTQAETAAGVSPGIPLDGPGAEALIDCCPTGALSMQGDGVSVDRRRCVHCYRCARTAAPLAWQDGHEWATTGPAWSEPLAKAFSHSAHVLVMDAGDCGACLNEVKQLNNPYYNMHRLGFFITPTPRHADILIVVGPATDHLRLALEKTYRAMPEPRRVIAVGACALTGGVLAPSFVGGRGVGDVVPVDIEVPGHPPPPLAILHALLVAVGRKPLRGSAER